MLSALTKAAEVYTESRLVFRGAGVRPLPMPVL